MFVYITVLGILLWNTGAQLKKIYLALDVRSVLYNLIFM